MVFFMVVVVEVFEVDGFCGVWLVWVFSLDCVVYEVIDCILVIIKFVVCCYFVEVGGVLMSSIGE